MISAVIPAFNETGRVGETVRALASIPEIGEVIVVDDGSTDGTAKEADAAGATVIRFVENRGKGEALKTGVEAAAGDFLVFLDADLGTSAVEAGCLIMPVISGEADMSIATFPVIPGKGGGLGFVVRLARWGIERATGREMAAPLSGQRVMRRAVLDTIGAIDPGFGAEAGLTIDALCAGFRVLEVATTMTHRVTGRDMESVIHRARQFRAVASVLWKRRRVRCR